jgi:hypothetical protein
MPFVSIVALAVGAACTYGVLHDLVTAHLCVEYFTIGHPRVFATESPVLLALGWGVLATWWMGLLLGLPLALAARVGSWPRVSARELVRPVLVVLVAMGLVALAAGLVGWAAASSGGVRLLEPTASRLPPERHVPFLADLWAHVASYAAGALGGLALVAWTLAQRRRRARAPTES